MKCTVPCTPDAGSLLSGMSFLIGGILFLAGTQLIFPSRKTHPNTITAKINIPPKPATATDFHSFTAGSFTITRQDNSGDHHNTDALLNTNSSLAFSSGLSSGPSSGSENIIESVPDKIQNTSRIKPIQPVDQNSCGKHYRSACFNRIERTYCQPIAIR